MDAGNGGATTRGARRGALAFLLASLAALPPGAGCDRPRPARERPSPLRAVQVHADTGRTGRLSVRLPAARVWVVRVTPARPSLPAPPPPEPAPEVPPSAGEEGSALEVAPGLLPPVLRTPVPTCLRQAPALPPGRRAADAWVDLEVRVDEAGAVTSVEWRGGSGDTALVESARRCALAMRFHPALRAGVPVAVWCRQRFDFRDAPPPGERRAGR
jgi:TonB family protein